MVFEKIAAIVSEQFGVEEENITREMSFADDLNADSLDIVELIMSIEEEFDLGEIEDESLENILTVGDAEAFVKERIE